MKLKNFICDMKAQGFTDEEIRYFLEDGEALKNEGFSNQNEVDTEHEKIALKELVNSLSDDELYKSWELKNNPRLNQYLNLIECSDDLYVDQIMRGIDEHICFSKYEFWVFLHDDWHGFRELREAIEYVIDFYDYNLEGRA